MSIRGFFADQQLLSFNSSSILILYEGTNLMVRLIDFAHCFPLSGETNPLGFISCAPKNTEDPPSIVKNSSLHSSLGGANKSQLRSFVNHVAFCFLSAKIFLSSLLTPQQHQRKASHGDGWSFKCAVSCLVGHFGFVSSKSEKEFSLDGAAAGRSGPRDWRKHSSNRHQLRARSGQPAPDCHPDKNSMNRNLQFHTYFFYCLPLTVEDTGPIALRSSTLATTVTAK